MKTWQERRDEWKELRYQKTDLLKTHRYLKNQFKKDKDGQWWYCHKHGRNKAFLQTCQSCGKEFPCRIQGAKTAKTCGLRGCVRRAVKKTWATSGAREKMSGKNAHNYKGGLLNQRGYMYVLMPDHPTLKGTQRRYVRRCRLVMEKAIGRVLESWEQVHHKNGVTTDDRPSNLEIWIVSHPAGRRDYYCPRCDCKCCVSRRAERKKG